MPDPFRKVSPGQQWQPSARLTNATIDAIRAMRQLQRTGGRSLTANRPVWGVITDAGPEPEEGEPPEDYTDERYWVKLSHIDGNDSVTTDPADQNTHITTSFSDDPAQILTATNIAELYLDKEEGGISSRQSGTHALPKGLHVRLEFDIDGRGNRRYWFLREPKYVVRVIGNETTGGYYSGKLHGGAVDDLDTTATFGQNSYGPLLDEEVVIMNLAEEGQTTHMLTEGAPISRSFPATRRARKSDDDRHVFAINGIDYKPCTPA